MCVYLSVCLFDKLGSLTIYLTYDTYYESVWSQQCTGTLLVSCLELTLWQKFGIDNPHCKKQRSGKWNWK